MTKLSTAEFASLASNYNNAIRKLIRSFSQKLLTPAEADRLNARVNLLISSMPLYLLQNSDIVWEYRHLLKEIKKTSSDGKPYLDWNVITNFNFYEELQKKESTLENPLSEEDRCIYIAIYKSLLNVPESERIPLYNNVAECVGIIAKTKL